jgi:hypothetical protein
LKKVEGGVGRLREVEEVEGVEEVEAIQSAIQTYSIN